MAKEVLFIKKVADALIEGLIARANEIPEKGDSVFVYNKIDASEIYGEGWCFALNVRWVKDLHEYFMELAAYNFPDPYKCDLLVGMGTKQDILNRLRDPNLAEEIAKEIPNLKQNLEES